MVDVNLEIRLCCGFLVLCALSFETALIASKHINGYFVPLPAVFFKKGLKWLFVLSPFQKTLFLNERRVVVLAGGERTAFQVLCPPLLASPLWRIANEREIFHLYKAHTQQSTPSLKDWLTLHKYHGGLLSVVYRVWPIQYPLSKNKKKNTDPQIMDDGMYVFSCFAQWTSWDIRDGNNSFSRSVEIILIFLCNCLLMLWY